MGESLTDGLKRFLAGLAIDPAALARFLTDPERAMAEADLGEEDRQTLRGDGARPAAGSSTAEASEVSQPGEAQRPRGSLVVVGTGIRSAGQLTVEAIAHIQSAEKVLYVVAEPVAEEVIRRLNPAGAESLAVLYGDGKPRRHTYRQMIDRILACVRQGLRTCAVFYGHPGVFVTPAHRAVREARQEGFAARMLPGVSAEDCLFADLGLDPAAAGCQSFEATDFLVNHRRADPTSALILWQIGVIGDPSFSLEVRDSNPLELLVRRLTEIYPEDHRVCIYEAAMLPGFEPLIRWLSLSGLARRHLSIISTLYLPPTDPPRFDPVLYSALARGG